MEEGKTSQMEKSRNTGQSCQVFDDDILEFENEILVFSVAIFVFYDEILVPKLDIWNILRVTSLRDLGQTVLSFHWDALPSHEYITYAITFCKMSTFAKK